MTATLGLAGLAVRPVATAVRAVLLQLEPVRVVAPVLLGDVVAVLALLASQCDLGPNIGGSHGECLSTRENLAYMGKTGLSNIRGRRIVPDPPVQHKGTGRAGIAR